MTTDSRLTADVSNPNGGEGRRLVAYKDPEGYWTIGFGHMLQPPTKDWTGTTWNQSQADYQLSQDLAVAQAHCEKLPEWASLDTDCRRNAVVELYFNMGSKWLTFMKARAALVSKDWEKAAAELLNSKWAIQVKAARADRIANYIRTGEYP